MKRLKYSVACLIAALVLLMQTAVVMAAEGSVTYGSSSYSPTEGQEFQVGVYVNGSEAVGAYEFYLNYDASMMEYVSGADSGGAGRLKFVGYGNASSYNYMLTFRAIKAGSCDITISNVYIGPLNPASGDSMTVTTAASAPVNIQGPSTASGECRLSELSVSPTGLWGFSPDKTEYDITVDNDVSKLAITAKAESEKASVVISDTNLAVGVNTITIKVTAENGTVKNYSIIVRRKPAEAEPQSTTAVSNPEIENLSISFQVNGKDMYMTESIEDIEAPEGFQKTTVTYNGQEIPAFTSLTQNITLFYLQDGLGENGAFYAYSSAKDNVYPYIRLTNTQGSFLIISPDTSVVAPEGYTETNLALSNGGDENVATTIQAWIQGGNTEFFLLYALNDKGEVGFYQYDTVEKTLQRFNSSAVAVKPQEQESSESTEGDAQKIADLEASLIKLKLNNQIETKNKLMIIIVLAVFCVVLIITVIGLIFKLKGQAEDGIYEEDEYDESEEESYEEEDDEEYDEDDEEEDDDEEYEEEVKIPVKRQMKKVEKPELISYIEDDAEESQKEAAAAVEAVREERVPEKKVENVEKAPKKEATEAEFLLDLDDDDFTFFDYDDDDEK